MPSTVIRHGKRGYKGWHSDFRQHGFVQVWRSADTYGLGKGGTAVQYTAWARGEEAVLSRSLGDSCVPFARQNNFTVTQLRCKPIININSSALWVNPRS
jgi:hypothetical protein